VVVTASDTWGISGISFLWIYGLLGVGCIGLVWLGRRRLLEAPRRSHPQSAGLGPYELAVLNGGPTLAVTAAASRLRSAAALEPGEWRHTLQVSGSLSANADPLEREVFEAVHREPGIAIRQLRAAVVAGPAAAALTRRLTAEGLLLDPRRARLLRWIWLSLLPLLGFGIARLVAGTENNKPIGYLAVMLCWLLIAIGLFATRHPRATNDGVAALEAQRSTRATWRLAPADIPSSLAVALFGGAALWLIDPAFAAAWSVPRERAAAYISNYAGGYGYGGCGGGGGGGGCGGCGG
jgi:uncharacterized protein (TIGR04222 family)